jgi:hypothetical protein
MRILTLTCLTFAAVSVAAAQSSSSPVRELPKDPRGMLEAALPQYDFNATTMKPWHMKGSYQLYDAFGKPAQQGSYEYWRESPKLYRSSWNRTGATRTEWHTIDGKTVYKAMGDRLFYFERKLETLLFSPVPDPAALESAGVDLEMHQLETNKMKLPCAEIKDRTGSNGATQMSVGVAPGSYCFDSLLPVLRVEQLFNSVNVVFDKLARMQNRVLSREIIVTDGRNKILTFNLDVADVDPNQNAALIPQADATPVAMKESPTSPRLNMISKKAPPAYPLAAKASHVTGTGILDTMIGKDGRIKDTRVLGTPSPLLTPAAKDAVAQWQYASLIVNGQSQEVNTIIVVTYSLGH